MELIDSPAAMQRWSDDRRCAGGRVVLVPTMGALHAGHRRLVEVAHDHGDTVVVSIFVNPLQFDVRDDFDRYPRTLDDDLAQCRAAGVHAVYAPTAATMYPEGFQTYVEPGSLAEPMEGAGRPGHFRGVTTVVTKLFSAVRPHVAIFGQKDYQQLAIIRRMAQDLDTGIEIVAVPTVREPDGVALSSRNARLSEAERAAAACLPHALYAARDAFAAGERSAERLRAAAAAVVTAEPRARLEYVEIADADTLSTLMTVDRPALVALAVWFGDVRLIDNLLLVP
jgi:pantoate--beta-alanine ligase